MKISKLHIDQFRHLENLDFDFTYQSGERKGQPLNKICFIGQSASGKTILGWNGSKPHIYRKKQTRPYRKMGDVTVVNEDIN